MTADLRRDGSPRNHKCGHGLSAALTEAGDPVCKLCRFEMGLPVAVAPRTRPRPGYCGVPGHEPFPRGAGGCSGCNAETAVHRPPTFRPDPDAPLRAAGELAPLVPFPGPARRPLRRANSRPAPL